MQALNSNNCLTCLHKIENDSGEATNTNDVQLQRLLMQLLDWQQAELASDQLPQRLCCTCCQLLQRFEQFQQQARICRQQLLDNLQQQQQQKPQPAGFEIIYDEETALPTSEQLLETPHPAPDPFDDDTGKSKRCPSATKNSFKCMQCGHSFARRLTHDAHVRKVHEGNKRPFQCDRCDKAYSFMGGLYTHIKELHGSAVRSHRCDHPGCERVYVSRIAMHKHKRLKHQQPTPASTRKYVCEQCGATFNQTANLKHHRRTKHPTAAEAAANASDSVQYYCDLCQKHFHSRYTLKYHRMQQHTDADEDRHECRVCGRRMAKRFMLIQHMLTHSAEKTPCEHCGRLFTRKFELESHIRAVHLKLKPFTCSYCDESFASRKTLQHHEYIHTGEKPYVCPICGQAFRQQTCLKNHGKIHDKSK
ncbi:zinc finger protein 558 [Drosophila grimshawi]|uniref:GH12605 n=1 Tax=Drosophila grimshawi TaxID=7222 RepID=B4JK74_DROGR|nr:zinc finger protein 558 [Drosophila grimshawi]EDV99976.1 GH12605 [Drosophila grimshawi]